MIKIKSFIFTFLKGGAIGIANIIPGVSGGTIAVILGIYDKLINALSSLFKIRQINRKHILFLVNLSLGAVVVIFISANLITYLLDNYFKLLMFSIMGIILGSLPGVVRMYPDMKINLSRVFILLIGAFVVILLSRVSNIIPEQASVDSLGNIALYGYLILIITGILAGGTMIIPGISGSLIMVLLGQYEFVVYYIKELMIIPLVFLGIGVVFGILTFAKIISLLLKKFTSLTLYFVLGLILGACYGIYPGLPSSVNLLLISVLVFISGIILSFTLNKLRYSN